jgi:hypothetical protein
MELGQKVNVLDQEMVKNMKDRVSMGFKGA